MDHCEQGPKGYDRASTGHSKKTRWFLDHSACQSRLLGGSDVLVDIEVIQGGGRSRGDMGV